MPRGRPKGAKDTVRRFRRTNPPQSTSPTVNAVFDLITALKVPVTDVSDHLNMTREAFWYYKRGRSTPTILTIEEIADFLGYRLELVPKGDAKPDPLEIFSVEMLLKAALGKINPPKAEN